MRRHERQIFSYDMIVSSRAKLAPIPALAQLAQAWQASVGTSDAALERDRGALVYRLGDCQVDTSSQVLRMLVRRGDTHAANAVYSQRLTGIPRVIAKSSDEDGERAAHIVVSLVAESSSPNTYLCHVEGVPGLGHSLIQSLLNAITRAASKAQPSLFQYADPSGALGRSGSPKTLTHQPLVELVGHPSANMVGDIENGTMQGVTLVAARPHNMVGGNQYVVEQAHALTLKVDKAIPSSGRLQSLLGAFRSRIQDYTTARLRFVDPNGIPRQIAYDIATGTPEQQAYVQSYMITGITPPMDDSSTAVVPFLADRMAVRVKAERT